jgi:hypothetical protein
VDQNVIKSTDLRLKTADPFFYATSKIRRTSLRIRIKEKGEKNEKDRYD